MTDSTVLIVDGYNVVHSAPRYHTIAESDMDTARVRLIDDVVSFAHGSYEAVVVFDGASNQLSDGVPHDVAGVQVIYSPYGQEADTVIESVAASARAARRNVVVVTSDSQTQWTVVGGGVRRMSALEFVAALVDCESQRAELLADSGGGKLAISERVDGAVRREMDRMARGE